MKIPDSIKIGEVTYHVQFAHNLSQTHGDWGNSNTEIQIIEIEDCLSDERKWETFVHEVLHCCLIESNLSYFMRKTKVTDEDVCSTLDTFVLQALKQIMEREKK